jgi:hypothetical protein
MFASFCFRLACGLVGSLLLLSPREVNPRFYRAHFLIALALLAAGGAWLREQIHVPSGALLGLSLFFAFAGSVAWSLDRNPGGRLTILLSFLSCAALLSVVGRLIGPPVTPVATWVRDYSSAAVLGTAVTAMLMGHSYLIAPAMSLTPLRRLLIALFASLGLRVAVAAINLWFWTADHSLVNLEDETVLWLPLRWGLGFVGPLCLGWMAWQSAKIRSTQSATGILYIAVVFCFLGELTSTLLLQSTAWDL